MQMTGQRRLAASRPQAWQCLNDPQVLRACLPGCERFERHEATAAPEGAAPAGAGHAKGEALGAGSGDASTPIAYDVGMRVKVGPVSARFAGRVTLSDLQPPQSYRLAFEGQGGSAGFGRGTSQVRLSECADGCELDYDVTASVGGKLAQVGQRLIDAAARSMADDFFRRFEAELLARHPAAPAAMPDALPAAEATADGPEGSTNTTARPAPPRDRPPTAPRPGPQRAWLTTGAAVLAGAAALGLAVAFLRWLS